MSFKFRYGWPEAAIAGSCLALIILGAAFSQTDGLLAGNSTNRHVRDYNSTGSDDDLCVMASVAIFGLCFLLVGWLPSLGELNFLKSAAFSVAWLVQLLVINWIEVGAIFHTIRSDQNIVLLLWTATFALSPALVWGTNLGGTVTTDTETGERRIAI